MPREEIVLRGFFNALFFGGLIVGAFWLLKSCLRGGGIKDVPPPPMRQGRVSPNRPEPKPLPQSAPETTKRTKRYPSFGRVILGLGTLGVIALTLFPPFIGVLHREGDDVRRFIGHHFIGSQPDVSDPILWDYQYQETRYTLKSKYHTGAFVDTYRLGAELIGLLLATGGLWLLTRKTV